MILPPVGRWQKLLMTVAMLRPWIAERVRGETLRTRIGEQMLVRGRRRRSATDSRVGAKQFRTRHPEERLSGRAAAAEIDDNSASRAAAISGGSSSLSAACP